MRTLSAFIILFTSASTFAGTVTTARIPAGGVQPQAIVDDAGVIHLIYLKGDASASDIFYVRSSDAGKSWSPAIRVNSEAGAAIAMGTVRGAHLALGPDARPHVAWMGSQNATPRGPNKASPMLYTHLAADGKSFEPQRNVLTERAGLDGGGSIAVDGKNRVYVGWHAPPVKGAGEGARTVWVARSDDGGKTFGKEERFSPGDTGACGCCGMRLFADGENLLAIYRSATDMVNRDVYLVSQQQGVKPSSQKVAPVTSKICLMSTMSFTRSKAGIFAAWETDKRIEWAQISSKNDQIDTAAIHNVAGEAAGGRKHPSIADNGTQTLVAWAEGTGWNKGGAVGWQLYDRDGKPAGNIGHADRLPVWGLPAAVALKDGSFLVLY
jgi:hypothetical protein